MKKLLTFGVAGIVCLFAGARTSEACCLFGCLFPWCAPPTACGYAPPACPTTCGYAPSGCCGAPCGCPDGCAASGCASCPSSTCGPGGCAVNTWSAPQTAFWTPFLMVPSTAWAPAATSRPVTRQVIAEPVPPVKSAVSEDRRESLAQPAWESVRVLR